ncbi:MAG: uracil-DNA glycosylase family protein [Anaerolineales bacterium]
MRGSTGSTLPVLSDDPGAPLLIIGQAPGLTEYEQKLPFVSSSENHLFSWLQQAGLEETWTYEYIHQTWLSDLIAPARCKIV